MFDKPARQLNQLIPTIVINLKLQEQMKNKTKNTNGKQTKNDVSFCDEKQSLQSISV